ncbi:MAG TPA: glutaredoxin family protein, partial [Pyrinomonadaceae bacterium]
DDGVTLFVVPDCPLCTGARAWLARHRVPYVERDVKNDWKALRAMYLLTEQKLVPVFARGERALVRPTDKQLEEFLL